MGLSNGVWFRCLAEIPGLGYAGDPQRRATLVERNDVPEVWRSREGGSLDVSLSWPNRDGTTRSPASRQLAADTRKVASGKLRESLLTAFELPGEIMDYHFAMQQVIELLYSRRRQEPEYLPFVEWLAHLNARLVELQEKSFRISPEGNEYYGVVAFDLLVDLYEREGYLHEALALAERFARFRPGMDTVNVLRQRVQGLRSENA